MKENGKVVYNCYSASCSRSGGFYYGISVEDLNTPIRRLRKSQEVFSIPEHFIDDLPEVAIRWLERCNCMEAIQDKRAEVKWDVKLNRLVFLIKRNGVCYDAVGRILGGTTAAMGYKWFKYGSSNLAYTVQSSVQGNNCMVAEDAASVCSASRLLHGVGLLGTILIPSVIKELQKYEEVFIALDPDAKLKAMDMYTTLSQYVKCKIVFPPDDPKYLSLQELQECLK